MHVDLHYLLQEAHALAVPLNAKYVESKRNEFTKTLIILHLSICHVFFFFFQAEDGIRDLTVTGVQTCALPIFTSAAVPDGVDPATVPKPLAPDVASHVAAVVLFGMPNVRAMDFLGQPPVVIRSEERRVGKECRSRWSPYH